MSNHIGSNNFTSHGKWAIGLATLLAVVVLTGCAEKGSACSDEATVATVKKIYQEAMTPVLAVTSDPVAVRAQIESATSVELLAIRTVGKDDRIGQVSCEASLSVKVPAEIAKAISIPGNLFSAAVQSVALKVNGDRLEKEIEYKSQMTDDGKQVRVVAVGAPEMGQLIATLAMTGLFKPSEPVATSTAQAPTGQAPAAPVTADTPETMVNTRFGAVKIDGGQQVLFKGVPLSPGLEAGDHLRIVKTFQIGDRDAVLIEAINGTLCPSNLYIATVSATGITATPSFGTCSDEREVSQVGDAVRITMSGFAPNSSSKAEQEAAANEVHAFVYRNGTVNEEAHPKAAAAAPAGPSFSCAGKLSPAEKLICDTPALADADAKLGRLYAVAVSKASDPTVLKQQQRDWQRIRNACTDTICMTDTYGKRLAELSR